MPSVNCDRVTRAGAGFDPIPSRLASAVAEVRVAPTIPEGVTVLGIPVFADGAVPDRQEFDRATLDQSGSASAALLTPVATPVNLIAMGAAGYRFGDYWRLGLVVMAVFFLVAVFVVPIAWPF